MDPQSRSKAFLMQQHLESRYLKANTRAYKTAFQKGLVKARHRFYPPSLPSSHSSPSPSLSLLFFLSSFISSRGLETVPRALQKLGKCSATEPHLQSLFIFNLYEFPDTSQTLLTLFTHSLERASASLWVQLSHRSLSLSLRHDLQWSCFL